MKRITLLLILFLMWLLPAGSLYSQQRVTLQQCFDAAAAASPLAGEKDIHIVMQQLSDHNLASSWLPSADLGATANYHSDVVDMSEMLGTLPIPPGMLPTIPHGQYRATAEISQVIWDGGVTRSAREVERVITELKMQQSEADLYRLREQVSNYFFTLLLVRSQADVTALLIGELELRLREAESGIANGVVLQVTADVIRAALITARQEAATLSMRHDALAGALEQITGMSGLKDAVLLLPEQVITGTSVKNNPDLLLFDTRGRQLELAKEVLRSQQMPRLFGFAQAGYGMPPGNNFLADRAGFFYSLGAGLRWNIWDWNRSSNERRSLTLQQQLLVIRKSTAEEALQRLLTIKRAEIASLRDAASHDEELIALRGAIAAAAASQLRNGTITASQYLAELNSERQAVIAAEARKIGIARAGNEYLYITGYKTE